MAARGYLFEGDVYMARIVNGVAQKMQGPLAGTRFGIKPNVERKEMESRGKGTFGQTLETVNLPKPADFSVTLNEGTVEVLALGLAGTVAVLSQTAGNLTAVDVVAELDRWVPLTKAALTGSATVTNTGATTTYVEGVDYLLNRDLGWFKALSTGAIIAAQALKLTSAYGAWSGSRILGATASDLRVAMVLDGRNLADGSLCTVTVHEAVLAASDVVDFLSGEFVGVPLEGRMKTPAGKTEPYAVDVRGGV